MAAKNPIRGDYSGSDLVGFAEFQASDFIAIADGGTGAITAAGARTALGLAIGSDIQSYDPQLTDIANLTPTDGGFIVGDGSNFVLETGNTARASLGLSTSDSPQFNGITLTSLSLDSVTLSAVITESEGMSGSDNDTSIPTTAAIIDYVAGQIQNEESIEDFVGGMVTGNTETLISVTYDDTDGTLDFVVDNDLSNYDNTTSAFISSSSTDTLTNKTINADNNTVSNLEVDNLKSGVLDTDLSTVAATDTTIPSAKAVKTYVDAIDVDDDLSVSDGTTSSTVNLDSDTLTIQGTSNEVEISNSSNTFTVGLPSDVTIGNNLTVTGNLTVSGTTTEVNTETLTVDDNIIVLNDNVTGTPTENAGIEIERGTATNKTLLWNETDDKWTIGSETFVAGTFEGALTGNVTGTVSSISNHDTDSLSEGSTNLYYTATRFNTAFSGKSTSDLTEGTNLYYTDARVSTYLTGGTGITESSGTISIDFSEFDTDNVSEGSSNLYYTDTRTRGAISVAASSGLTYNSSTGEIGTSSIPNAQLANSSITINSNAVSLGGSVSLDTDDITEGTNLYYTNTRFDTRLGTKTTDNLTEGSTNLYFTNERVDDRVDALLTAGTGITLTYDDTAGSLTIASTNENVEDVVGAMLVTNGSHTGISFAYDDAGDGAIDATVSLSSFDTDNLSEGSTNLYYTDARVESYLSGGTGIDFSSGAISIDSTVVTESSTDTLTNKTINFEDNTAIVEFAVTVANVSGNKYHLDGETAASIQLVPGITYRFDTSDSSNSGHPFLFSTTKNGTHNSGTNYTTGVTTNGTPGSTGAYTQIVVNAATADTLYYYCQHHSGMGGDAVVSVAGSSLSASTTDNLTEGSSNLYYTDTRARGAISVTDSGGDGSLSYNSSSGVITYTGPSASETRAHFSAGTGVTLSSGEISIGQAVGTSSDVTFNDLTVSGNLTVSGTTTTINTETLTVDDNIIVLNNNASGSPTENAGIEIERGSATNKTLIWNETDDKWTIGTETFVAGTFEGNLTGNVTGTVSDVSNHDTDDISEGSTNLYYTDSRFDTRLGTKTTDNLTEGSSNLYFSNERVDDRVNALLTAGSNVSLTYDDAANTLTIASTDTNTQLSQEEVEDYVAGVVTAGTGISVTYDDTAGTLTIANTASTSTEDVQDIVGGQIVTNGSHTGISFSYDDANDGAIDATVSLSGFSTSDLSEGTNLYYTDARFDTRLGTKDTDNLTEGSTNLYFTNTRADARADARIAAADLQDLSNVGFSAPGASDDAKVVSWDNTAGSFALSSLSGLSGSGETNTASNIGTAGVGLFDGKVGEDLQFKKINAGSSKITITDDTSNNEVDIDLGTVSIGDLSDVITTSVSNGQALVYSTSNSRFEPGDVTATLSGLTDTTISSLATNEIIAYNGSAWVNTDTPTFGDTTLVSTNTNANSAPLLKLYRNSASPADGDDLGVIRFTGENSGGSETIYGFINAEIDDASNSTGRLRFGAGDSGGTYVADIHTGGLYLTTGKYISFEGSSLNDFETTLNVTNPTADRTITLPDSSGTVALTSDIPSVPSDTDGLSEGSTNLYYTDARVETKIDSYVTGGTGVSISSGSVSIGQAVATTSDVNFATVTTTGNVTVGGNLTVSGTTTTVNTETINLADNIIVFNSNAPSTPTENAGIEIERGDSTNKTLIWNESTDKWTVGSETFVAGTFEGNATGLTTSAVTGLTADSSPADDDLILVYDTSATAFKKVTKSNLTGGGGGGALTGALDFTLSDSTEDDIDFLNIGATGTDIDVTLTDGTIDPIQITSSSSSATSFTDADTDTKIQVEATTDVDDIRMFTAGTERIRIESDGVVDIKSAKLKINGGAGTNGQVLTTGGDGTISWADAGGSSALNDLTDVSTSGVASGDSIVYNGSNFVPQRPTNIEDADGDTRVHVEESSDEDKIRFDTGGSERFVMDTNVTASANGGFFLHRQTLASGESFTIAADTGTVAAGPMDVEGTLDVAGTLVVV